MSDVLLIGAIIVGLVVVCMFVIPMAFILLMSFWPLLLGWSLGHFWIGLLANLIWWAVINR